MPVTDDQMAVLRAHLEGDFDKHKALFRQLGREELERDFSTLVSAALTLALGNGMSESATEAQVINLVSDIRQRYFKNPDALDPKTAERLILFGLNPDAVDLDDIPPRESVKTQHLLLFPLVHEAGIPASEGGLDAFLEEARALANEWIDANEAENKAE